MTTPKCIGQPILWMLVELINGKRIRIDCYRVDISMLTTLIEVGGGKVLSILPLHEEFDLCRADTAREVERSLCSTPSWTVSVSLLVMVAWFLWIAGFLMLL